MPIRRELRIPCRENQKIPLVKWKQFLEIPPTQLEEERWVRQFGDRCNWAILTGKPSSCFIIDIDPDWEADEFPIDDLERLAFKVVGTPRGGKHLYFRLVGDANVRNSAGKLAVGVDVRGTGGYVLVPPSVIDERPYTVISDRSRDTLAGFAPAELLERIEAVGEPEHRIAPALPSEIPQNKRNDTLTSEGGKYRRYGFEESEILAMLLAINEQRCKPPLPKSEVATIAASVARYAPPEIEIFNFNTTDVGNVKLFVELYQRMIKFNHKMGKFFMWKDYWWKDDRDGEIARLALESVEFRRYEAHRTAINEEQEEIQVDWSYKCETKARLSNIVEMVKDYKPLADDGEGWDANPWLLGVGNGVVDLRTGKLVESNINDLICWHTPVRFEPKTMQKLKGSRWYKFLYEIFSNDKDLVDFIWRSVGYSITGVTDEQVMFLLYGEGANGKGTFVRALRNAFGQYGHNTPMSTFDRTSKNQIPADVADLNGKRFVTASEITEGAEFNEERVKSLTGQDELTARHLYGQFFSFVPKCKLWLSVNHRPEVRDDTLAFWRRMRLIPFETSFLVGKGRNNDLDIELEKESELILAWAIQGAIEWQKRSLEPPKSVLIATAQYKTESNVLEEFITERCFRSKELWVNGNELYHDYMRWMESERRPFAEKLKRHTFGRRLVRLIGTDKRRKSNSSYLYDGIGLKREWSYDNLAGWQHRGDR